MRKSKISKNINIFFNIFFILIVIGFGGYFITSCSILPMNRFNEARDNFCIEKGANYSADYKLQYEDLFCGWDGCRYLVECNDGNIYSALDTKPCIKYDKWKQCITYGSKLK